MDDTSRDAIRIACQDLSVRFAYNVDHGNAEAVAALFVTDGSFSSAGRSIEGSDGVFNAISRRPANRVTRHVCTNILIDVEDDTHASGNTYFLLFEGHDDAQTGEALPMRLPVTVGEYQDEFIRTADGWKISQRKAIGVFRHAEA